MDIRPDGDKLQLRPPGKAPAELLQAIRQHKAEIMAILTKPRRTILEGALTQKGEEIMTMRKRMASEYYADDSEYLEWCRDQIGCLTAHITEIHRYLREGGSLRLPPCCKEEDYLCLIAMRRFNGCLMAPSECEFTIENADVDSHNAKKMPQSNISACRSADISRTE